MLHDSSIQGNKVIDDVQYADILYAGDHGAHWAHFTLTKLSDGTTQLGMNRKDSFLASLPDLPY